MDASPVQHGTDRLAYWGEQSFPNKRTGIWAYFDPTGAIQRDSADQGVGVLMRTGFYEDGVKVRELTEEEVQVGLANVRKPATMTRASMLRANPK